MAGQQQVGPPREITPHLVVGAAGLMSLPLYLAELVPALPLP